MRAGFKRKASFKRTPSSKRARSAARVSRKPGRKARTLKRVAVPLKLRKQIKTVVTSAIELQQTLPTSLLPVTDTLATRTVAGYLTNPIGTARIGKAFPLVSLSQQFPTTGIGENDYQGGTFRIEYMKYNVSMYFNFQAVWSTWRVMLVRLGERTDAVYKGQGTQPFNVEDLYPDMVMQTSVNYARTWPKPLGKFNAKYGTVVWSKLLNMNPLRKDFGGRTGASYGWDGQEDNDPYPSATAAGAVSLWLDNSFTKTQATRRYQNMHMNMEFVIPMKKTVKDYISGKDIPNTIPRYSLFIYEENQAGRPVDWREAPAMYVEEVQTFTKFRDV